MKNKPSKNNNHSGNPILRSGLYLVSTPIGNLGDLSSRAIKILSHADYIACEDTRITLKLLRAIDVSVPLVSYHEHSPTKVRYRLLDDLKNGKSVVLVSDAGTPLISDPGYKLVRLAAKEDIFITAIPGASSPIVALVLSGLPPDRFFFAGYLPPKEANRRTAISQLQKVPATLIFLESTRRLAPALESLADVLGNRPGAVARELTKLHEEVTRGNLRELAENYKILSPPKGEAVIVVGPPDEKGVLLEKNIDDLLLAVLESMSVKDSASMIAETIGIPRREVYARAVVLARNRRKQK
tara:strand:- start:517 stop:1410 length:894 start_codon:yes stop_codon:yes gene_type:complete